MLLTPQGQLAARCGPVLKGHPGPQEIAARTISNNTAELAAIIASSRWVASMLPLPTAVNFLFDSMWASCTARGLWRARKNATEVDAARRSIERLADLGVAIHWHHVRAHRGHFLNELADLTATIALKADSTADVPVRSLQLRAPVELQAALSRHSSFVERIGNSRPER